MEDPSCPQPSAATRTQVHGRRKSEWELESELEGFLPGHPRTLLMEHPWSCRRWPPFQSGKAAGLGSGPTVAFLTAESVSATFECVNKGGNVAPGHPAFESAVQGPTQHITPHQGQITFSVTIPPPP